MADYIADPEGGMREKGTAEAAPVTAPAEEVKEETAAPAEVAPEAEAKEEAPAESEEKPDGEDEKPEDGE
jgi:hypothetical protein